MDGRVRWEYHEVAYSEVTGADVLHRIGENGWE
jgi:hypothetical protein